MLTVAVAAVLSAVVVSPPGVDADFFPRGSLSRDPDEHASRSGWFGSVLRQFGELPLRTRTADEVYRLVKMPAFGSREMVRVERAGARAAETTWKRRPQPASGNGSAGPDARPDQARLEQQQRTLADSEWKQLTDRVAAAELANVTPDASEIGLDGVTYLLEARRKGSYRALFRWSPQDGSLYRLFETLLALARAPGGSPLPVVDPRATKPGRLVGRVTAGSRALPEVNVLIEGGGVVEDRTTDRAGRFAIEGLVPGLYAFRVDRPGFPLSRFERGLPSLLWEWDTLLEVRPDETVCVEIRYERTTPEPRIQTSCPAR
jgi:hypothetical protein